MQALDIASIFGSLLSYKTSYLQTVQSGKKNFTLCFNMLQELFSLTILKCMLGSVVVGVEQMLMNEHSLGVRLFPAIKAGS